MNISSKFKGLPLAIITTGLGGLLLSSCSVGPDYRKPKNVSPETWTISQTQAKQSIEVEQAWWQNFQDPILNQLIDKAARGNFDIKLASARIAEARASQASATAALSPVGHVIANATRQANQIGFPGDDNSSFSTLIKQPFNIFKTGFDASWELDLFGGHRRNAESARAEFEASKFARDALLVSTLAEVARTYIEIRQYQAQLQLAETAVAADTQTLAITQQKYAVGDVAGIEVAQAESQREHDQTQIKSNKNLLEQAEYRLDYLLGEQSGTTRLLLKNKTTSAIPHLDQQLILAAPAAVIVNRPDIREAERKLASATAQQGAALAKFFPDISLTGFIGLFNTNASNLLNIGSKSWSMGANVLWPILSYGSLSANLDSADAKQRTAMINYQKSLFSAFSDVERSVAAYTEQESYVQSQEKAIAADQQVCKIVRERYDIGLNSLIEVLEAERKLHVAENQLLLAKAQSAQNLIAVYKSLGGGWKNLTKESIKSKP